jgi:hypothetical protein
MGLYDLHRLLFDVRSKASIKETYLSDPEHVFQRYALTEEELTALRSKDIYRLHKLGVSTYLLAPFACTLGVQLPEFGNILRAGAEAERQQQSA